jgi:hypothetical protein
VPLFRWIPQLDVTVEEGRKAAESVRSRYPGMRKPHYHLLDDRLYDDLKTDLIGDKAALICRERQLEATLDKMEDLKMDRFKLIMSGFILGAIVMWLICALTVLRGS